MSPYHFLGPTRGPRRYEKRHGPPPQEHLAGYADRAQLAVNHERLQRAEQTFGTA